MVRLNTHPVVIFPIGLCCVFLAPAFTQGQSAHRTGREGFTGQQLFEHQWKSLERSEEPIVDEAQDSKALREKSNTRARRSASRFDPESAENERLALGDGLGPLHNAKSCAECHPGGGASGVEHNVTHLTVDPRSAVVKHIDSGAATLRSLFPAAVEVDGSLLFDVLVHDRSTRGGYSEIRSRLAKHVPGGIDDAWFLPAKRTPEAIASRPVIAGRYDTVDFYLSQLSPPSLFGVGRIEKIPQASLVEIAAWQAKQSGGTITGRVAGRLGWRGQGLSVSQIVADACVAELGLAHDTANGLAFVPGGPSQASRPQPDDPADPTYLNLGVDMTQSEVLALTAFVTSLPPPVEIASGDQASKELLAGEKLFASIGCEMCHVADVHSVRGLFSDLLLHDMGASLQAPSPAPVANLNQMVATVPVPKFKVEKPQRPPIRGSYYGSTATQSVPVAAAIAKPEQPHFPRGEAADDEFTWDALQREWRTPPLWGVADTAPYLHDGRAATLEEAIMWHAGEGEWAQKRFAALPRAEKDLVLLFLATLQAPKNPE